MAKGVRLDRPGAAGSALPTDTDFIEEAARLKRATASTPDAAKKYLLIWLLIEAHEKSTTPGAVLDNLVRSQPSRNDQYGLLRRFRAALREDA